MTNSYNFNSRETYLAAVAEWKANYAHLTEEARRLRAEYNQAQSNFGKTSIRNHAEYWAAHKLVQALRNERDTIRHEARDELAVRFNMKVQAAEQWEEARALA